MVPSDKRWGGAGKPLVNFDVALGELVREARWLGRLGCEVPEAARRVLLQEHKFKFYYSRLAHLLRVPRPLPRSLCWGTCFHFSFAFAHTSPERLVMDCFK